ncbi:hypothetical protein CEXT_395521 [Caerostris extrusa]|uniref:Uncharacterized protein n=1 Tax=Caerostris extrusa TaxID=172846 RepID=A0AAV4TDT3_CAEEX|nr:hypothetical protein CEXT_395521 [Caerostris extrusa]
MLREYRRCMENRSQVREELIEKTFENLRSIPEPECYECKFGVPKRRTDDIHLTLPQIFDAKSRDRSTLCILNQPQGHSSAKSQRL